MLVAALCELIESFPMSNTSLKCAFALVVVLTSVAASLAHHAVAATRNTPNNTIDSSRAGKCFQGSSATAADHKRAEFVHSGGVCWAPESPTDVPGV